MSATARRATVLDLELEALPPRLEGLERYDAALALVRRNGRPVGQAFFPLRAPEMGVDELRRAMLRWGDSALWEAWLRQRLGVEEEPHPGPAPPATVAVCTRDRPDDLRVCLAALLRLPDDGQELLVVDNAPSTDETRRLVASHPRVRYVREERPGLDIARNRALHEASHDLVAFTDDDAAPDPLWLRALARNFTDDRIMCVTGLTFPMELETPAQLCYQRLGGLGRGMKRFELDAASFDPLLGWQAGAGVNMALRRDVLDRVGPFDELLDAGTPVGGGGDSDMFRRVLTAGYRIVHDPAALVWHRHRREWVELRKQLEGYDSAGFAIWARAWLLEGEVEALSHGWLWLWRELRNLGRTFVRSRCHTPHVLLLARFRGASLGPWRYFRSRREAAASAGRAVAGGAGSAP